MSAGLLKSFNTRNSFEFKYDYNYEKEYDVEFIYARSLTRFLDIYAGADSERTNQEIKPTNTAILEIRYILPILAESNFRTNSKEKLRLALASDLQLTKRAKFACSYNRDKEYRFNRGYEINKKIILAANYDSDFKWGAGLRIRF